MESPGEVYIVKLGDTLTGIAHTAGFRSTEAIFYHPENNNLRRQRPDGELFVDDKIFIPEKRVKQVQIGAFGPDDPRNRQYVFQVKTLKAYFSYSFTDENDEPYANKRYELEVDGETYADTTDANGYMSQAVSPTAKQANLTLWPSEDDATKTVSWEFPLGAGDPEEMA
ncbi:hypothetical protein Lepto7375DRAFT_1405 [Leptolyngbya sp. PCC 7375]|nr:hypothetical protein Lepto7375DRAFT_1405 [Leptolyngbya sp. PCC 7375]